MGLGLLLGPEGHRLRLEVVGPAVVSGRGRREGIVADALRLRLFPVEGDGLAKEVALALALHAPASTT